MSPPVAVQTYWARTGQRAARLNASGSQPQPLGPLTQVGVQKGDTVRVTAYGLHPQAQTQSFWFSFVSFLANLVGQQPPAPTGVGADPGRGRRTLPLLQVGVSAGLASLTQLGSGVPKGYLRVLVFNQDSVLVDQQTRQLSTAAYQNYEPLQVQLVLPQNGYVTAYVGNEGNVDVFFDDVTVEHRSGLQVQENQYDPAGLEMAGVTAPSPGLRVLNNYRFNGKEFQADLGLAWNHQDWRFFDPQLLRWHTGDPELENGQESWTPYSFGYDNAVRYADANGRAPGDGFWGNTLGGLLQGAVNSLPAHFGAQAAFTLLHPLAAMRIGTSEGIGYAGVAMRIGTNSTLDGKNEGLQNALRHGTWQAIMAQGEGLQVAQQVGVAHGDDPKAKSTDADTKVDINNNRVGQAMGADPANKGKTPQQMALAVLDKVKAGEFQMVSYVKDRKGNTTTQSVPTSMSDKQYDMAKKAISSLDSQGRTPEQALQQSMIGLK